MEKVGAHVPPFLVQREANPDVDAPILRLILHKETALCQRREIAEILERAVDDRKRVNQTTGNICVEHG
jgi:hypothetical protein